MANNTNEQPSKNENVEDWNIVTSKKTSDNQVDWRNAVLAEATNNSSSSSSSDNSPTFQNIAINQNRSKKQINIDRVIALLEKGVKTVILLRGLPGSGKSYLGKYILTSTTPNANPEEHIFSTDNFFVDKNGVYKHDSYKLTDAHAWNQRRATEAMFRGVTPILIDNTNIELWEMKPYATVAADCGYAIEILESGTHWAFNCKELHRRNQHNVPKDKIENMLLRYDKSITTEKLCSKYNIKCHPKLNTFSSNSSRQPAPDYSIFSSILQSSKFQEFVPRSTSEKLSQIPPTVRTSTETATSSTLNTTSPKRLESKLTHSGNPRLTSNISEFIPRNYCTNNLAGGQKDNVTSDELNRRSNDNEEFKRIIGNNVDSGLINYNNWSKENETENFWHSDNSLIPNASNSCNTRENINMDQGHQNKLVNINKYSLYTEMQDANCINTENSFPKKINEENFAKAHTVTTKKSSYPKLNMEAWGLHEDGLIAWNDINMESMNISPTHTEKTKCESKEVDTQTESTEYIINTNNKVLIGKKFIPAEQVKICSSLTTKIMLDKSASTEEIEIDPEKGKILTSLKNLFTDVPSYHLRDIAEKCKYDLLWAAEILSDDKSIILPVPPINLMEDTIPNDNICNVQSDIASEPLENNIISNDLMSTKESENRDELKRLLESKITINENTYSDHILKIKKQRYQSDTVKVVPSTSKVYPVSKTDTSESENDSDSSDNSENEFMELNIGEICTNQLEAKFGHPNLSYPKGLNPTIQIPIALARQLHAFYIESMYQQLDEKQRVLEKIKKEDEEFANKIQAEEYNMEISFEETAIEDCPRQTLTVSPSTADNNLNLREIMQEEAILSRHRKEAEKWKDITPENLAFKLTKQKLFENFPHINKDVLLEILHAHDNCYAATVDSILASCDEVDVEAINRIRQPPITQNAVEEMRIAQEKCFQISPIDLDERPAAEYRKDAQKILQLRSDLYEQATQYFNRGMREVAAFYSNLAQEQTRKYDYANNVAAHAFLNEHSTVINNTETIDLHYLKINEAITSLDIFVDQSIQKLQSSSLNTTSLYVITGRGKRSTNGKSKLKPAVMRRLTKRQIEYSMMNPGLLKIKIFRHTKLTNNL